MFLATTCIRSAAAAVTFPCFKAVRCWVACTIVKLMHGKGCLVCLANKAAAHFLSCWSAGWAACGYATFAGVLQDSGYFVVVARTRRQVACHARSWAPSLSTPDAVDSSALQHRWGAAKPSCSCLGVGLMLGRAIGRLFLFGFVGCGLQ